MKIYLEITEQLSDEQKEQAIQPAFLRVEKQSEQECRDAAPQIVALLFSGKTVEANIHICVHDEAMPCQLIPIEL
jgi:hypothetical protein